MAKVRLRTLVNTEEAMKKFIVDYRIPPNVGLRNCEEGDDILGETEAKW